MKIGKKKQTNDEILCSEWGHKFKLAMVHKSEYTKKWEKYKNAYSGDYFKNVKLPNYRSDEVSNYIFGMIETIRPIMLDNDPKFQVLPRHKEAVSFSNDLQNALNYEFDREHVNTKLQKELINALTIGTSVFFIPWDNKKKEVGFIPVSAFNIFPDPLATCVDDAEYIIYASYVNENKLKLSNPKFAKKLSGSSINYSELVDNNDYNSDINNQILVLEIYTRDYESLDEKSEIKYKNGRVITLCPEIGVVLSDKENPYVDGQFPFVLLKDYDVPGKFWGEGEVSQLLSPQKSMNDLNNAILDNAKATANMPWIIDKNSGIGANVITARPGLIIRKNPGTEVRRDMPPQMPMYVTNQVEVYKKDIETISGIHNSVRGESATGVYTAQGILALQEAGQARVRLKVKILEESLSRMAMLWVSRMKQFWSGERWITITNSDGSIDLKAFNKNTLKYDYLVKITAGSTMPVNRGAMLDLMIRLAQTPMPDGQNLVDRESVAQYLPQEIKAPLLERMEENASSLEGIEVQIQELGQIIQQLGQGLEQLAQESHTNDEETFKIIEEVTVTIEGIKDQILQLSEQYDIMVEEENEKERLKQIEDKAYDKGYSDALQVLESEEEEIGSDILPSELPDELLSGLEGLTDEELEQIISENPEIEDKLY